MDRAELIGYPRPQLRRAEWLSLDGRWDFRFEQEDWQNIVVPYAYQCEMSGIGTNRPCDHVTYRRTFAVPAHWQGKRILLHFGAVDYRCDVFVNGQHVGGHTGGNVGFSLDITENLTWQEETVTVAVFDPWGSELIPRGKQHWLPEPESIWYRRTTGIWQSVWLEPVDACAIRGLRFTPDVDRGQVEIEYDCTRDAVGQKLLLTVSLDDRFRRELRLTLDAPSGRIAVDVFGSKIFRGPFHSAGWCWSPESPTLFDVTAEMLCAGEIRDRVDSYFGMRKVEARDGRVWLNNKPYYQKLVLDQGYWPRSLLTAPDEEALRQDILMAKAMGFNGCRKHQKTEDPRFLYWADCLGYLVWEEIGACPSFAPETVGRLLSEWNEAITRDYNHPCIVAWVTMNESWGAPEIARSPQQQALSMAMYYQAKAIDSTRLVVSNDGWEQCRTDICAIHNYCHGRPEETAVHEAYTRSLSTAEELLASMPAGRPVYAAGWAWDGAPILLMEFGGISLVNTVKDAWGYTQVSETDSFVAEYRRMLTAISQSRALQGFCYTQLTDVEQETNGLMTYDRQYKIDPAVIKAINDSVGR